MRRILFLLLALSTIAFPLDARAQAYLVVQSCGTLPKQSPLGSASGPIGIDRNGNLCTGAVVNVPPVTVTIPTPLNVSLTNTPGVTQATSPWVVSASTLSPVFGTVTSLQGTSPWIVSGTVLQGTTPWTVGTHSVNQGTSPWQVSLTNTPGVTQSTSPWIVSGTVLQGTSPWVVTGTVTVPPISIATPLSINIPQQGAVVTGAYADGSMFSIGSVADAIYNGSGSATVISALKGIYAAVKSITVTTNIPTPLVVSLSNTPGVTQATTPWIVQGNGPNTQVLAVTVTPAITASVSIPTPLAVTLTNTPGVTQATTPWIVSGTVLQGTSPWVVSASTIQGIFGSATTYQGTSPWIVSGTVLQGTSPWVVSASTIQGVFGSATVYQGTSPWTVTGTSLQGTSPWVVSGTVLQGTTPWTIQPNAASTLRVNPTVASQWGLGSENSASIVTAMMVAGVASTTEAPANNANTISELFTDLVGKLITSPYANRENYISGSVSTSGVAIVALIATPTNTSLRYYITDFGCTRNDAGTTAITVTTNDTDTAGIQGAKGWTVPNSGGGGGFMKTFNVPIKTATGTAFQIKNLIGSGVLSLMCSATGYSGY